MAKELELSNGGIAIVDDEDFEFLKDRSWYKHVSNSKTCRATYVECSNAAKATRVDGFPGRIKLHRFIMNAKEGDFIDHINGDTLDNRKCNLRFCSRRENKLNCSKHKFQSGKKTSSKYKGVHYVKAGTNRRKTGVWISRIRVNYKRILLGVFKEEADAALAYNEAAVHYFGEFAQLNIVGD